MSRAVVVLVIALASTVQAQPKKGPPAAPDETDATRAVVKLGGTLEYSEPRQGLTRKDMVRRPAVLKEGPVRGVAFDGPRLTNAELKTLVKSLAAFPGLQSLTFMNTAVTDDGLKPLAELKGLKAVEFGPGRINGSGLAHLADLGNLRIVRIEGNTTFSPA